MADKRRRARVQGGWASSSSSKDSKNSSQASQTANKAEKKSPVAYNFNPNVEIRRKPQDISFRNNGSHILSDTDNGQSRIILKNSFFDEMECDWIFKQLHDETPWKQELIQIKGQKIAQPRNTAWFGDISYTYSGLTLSPHQFSPLLVMLRDKIENFTKENKINSPPFNSLLANLYRGEKDSIDWHSDDEKSLGSNPVIASLSFGETRMFEMRRKDQARVLENGEVDYSFAQHAKILLSNGSLLIMDGACQTDWQHRIPKEYHDRGVRINLTFRTIYNLE